MNNTLEVISSIFENQNKKFKAENGGILKWDGFKMIWSNNASAFELNSRTMNYEWEECVGEKVTLKQVLQSKKCCKVEHELITENMGDEITSSDSVTLEDYDVLKEEKFMAFHLLMGVLPWILDDDQLRKVMCEGTWYLED